MRAPQAARDEAPVRIEIGAGEVEFGAPFPVRVVRGWDASLDPAEVAEWRDESLAPLVATTLRTLRSRRGDRIEEVREVEARAFALGELSVGPGERLLVRSSLPVADGGVAELPCGLLEPPSSSWKGPVAAIAIVLLAAALATIALRSRRRALAAASQRSVAPPPPRRDPYAEFVARLERLRGSSEASAEAIDAEAVEASSALREWLHGELAIRAPFMSGEEIAEAARRRLRLPADALESLAGLHERLDAVKFARARPAPADRTAALDRAGALVRRLHEGAS